MPRAAHAQEDDEDDRHGDEHFDERHPTVIFQRRPPRPMYCPILILVGLIVMQS